MKKLGIYTAISVFVLTLSTVVFAATVPVAGKMTLQEAVTAGILKNPEYGTSAEDALASREVLFQAKGLNLPNIDLSTQSGPEYTNSPFVKNQDLWTNRSTLSLSQLLFDGWGARSQINREKAHVKSAVKHAGGVAENAGLDSAEAFLDVLRQRDLLTISRANVAEHMRILDMISAGAIAGTVTQGDVAQVKARLAQARASLASAEENLRNAEATFAQKTGDMPGELEQPSMPQKSLPKNVEDAVHIALTHNPALDVAASDIEAASAEKVGADSLLYPRVNLEANAMVGENLTGIVGNQKTRSVLAVARWNLYHGGADMARRREALHREASAKERRNLTARNVEKETRNTWAAMISAADRSKEFEEQATANKKVVSVYLDQFSISRRSLLDVLDAQNELSFSQSNSLNAAYAGKFAVLRLLALQGQLLDTLGVPKPREAILEQ